MLLLAQFARQFVENRIGQRVEAFRVRFNARNFHGEAVVFAEGGSGGVGGEGSEITLSPEDFVDG